jgi:hypothetical protein
MIEPMPIDGVIETALAAHGPDSIWFTDGGDHERRLDDLASELRNAAVEYEGEWSYSNKTIHFRAAGTSEFRGRWFLKTW